MQDYEIRILNFDGSLCIRAEGPYLNSLKAIAAARKLAGNRPYEVWWDERCVYSSLTPPPIKPSPQRAAA